MSLEAIEKISRFEQEMQAKKVDAEAQARQILADATRSGEELLQKTRAEAAQEGKTLMQQAEDAANVRAEEIARAAQEDAKQLRTAAEAYLQEAAELIVERVVKQ